MLVALLECSLGFLCSGTRVVEEGQQSAVSASLGQRTAALRLLCAANAGFPGMKG